MKISIYDTELNRIAIIDNHFVSVYWLEGFNSKGIFTLELQNQDEYKQIIKNDYYVGRSDRKTLMVINHVEIVKNKIIASGMTADRDFQDVAMIGTVNSYQYIDKRIKELYNNSDKIDSVEFAETDIGVKASMQISNDDFQNVALTLAQKNNIGFRAIKGDGVVEGEFYLPKPNSSIFAEKYGNLILDRLIMSVDKYKNYAVVLGEGEDENRRRVDVDLSDGQERKRQIVADEEVARCAFANIAIYEVRTTLDHSLVNKLLIWLVLADIAEVVEELVPETAINQVTRSVLSTTYIKVDLTPVVVGLFAYKCIIVVVVHIAEVICRRSCKTWHSAELEWED